MVLKNICQAVKGSLHLTGASLGRESREISIPRLSLSHGEVENWPLSLGRARQGREDSWEKPLCVQLSLASCTALIPSQYLQLVSSLSSKGFSLTKSQCVVLIPLSQPEKRSLCKRHPEEFSVKLPMVQESSDTAENPEDNVLSTPAGLALAKLFHEMTLLRGQQHFPLPPQPLSSFQSQL